MHEIDRLLEVIDILLGPNGCPWDREQTVSKMRESVLEEVSELIDAISLNENAHIREELGDLLMNALFTCRLAEKENRCTTEEVVKAVTDKLVRRHPHVFGDAKVRDTAAVVDQWESLKQQEKKGVHVSKMDQIPKSLPALSRSQEMLKKMIKSKYPATPKPIVKEVKDETTLGEALLALTEKAKELDLDAETALRKIIAEEEKKYRLWEQKVL
jgi:tetrapyrrole methylase family protein/MazG family protein